MIEQTIEQTVLAKIESKLNLIGLDNVQLVGQLSPA